MEAFFADIKQWGVYSDYTYTPNPDLKGWSNDHPFPPEIETDSPYLRRRLERFQQQIDGLCAAVAKKLKTDAQQRTAFGQWHRWSGEFLKRWPDGWATPIPTVSLENKDMIGVNDERPAIYLHSQIDST